VAAQPVRDQRVIQVHCWSGSFIWLIA
jgi:hypothetical protein